MVIGDKEIEQGVVAVRGRKKGDLGVMPLEDFMAMVQEEIASKARD